MQHSYLEAVVAKFFRKSLQAVALLVLMQASVVFAQFSSGVQGSVLDTSGAAVSNATVTLENSGTHIKQTAKSDSAGVYRFTSLAPGAYSVTASAAGFSNAKSDFALSAAENRDVPLALAVGDVSQTVQVSSQAPLIDTSDTRNQYTIDSQALETLPQSNRNPQAVLGITPGVTGGLDAQNNNTTNPENFNDFSANGRGENGNVYLVDGLDVTSNIRPGVINLSPNGDSVQEATVQPNTYSVQYGRGSGFETVFTTKSGTDQFHGFGSIYYRYQAWAARGEFGPSFADLPKNPPNHTNNLSFGIGGPIWKSKNLFGFFSIQPYHNEGTNFGNIFYEDPAFTAFAHASQPNSPETALLTKYPVTNSIFLNVNQTALQYFGGTCGTAATNFIPCSTPVIDEGSWNNASSNTSLQYNARIDKTFSKDRVYANFIRSTQTPKDANPRAAFNITDKYYGLSLQVNETHTFSPTMLNEAAFGFNRIEGIQPSAGLFTVPVVNVTGLGQGFGAGFALGDYIQHSYHWRDVLTKIKGSHSFKAGYEGWTGDDTAVFQGPYGQPTFQFNNLIDLINNAPQSETSLSYNVLTGAPQPGNYSYKELTGGLFVEDTWKASKKVTVNYGIRYDNFGNPVPNGYGTIAAPFHLGSGSTFQDRIANGTVKAQSHSLDHDINWNFSPRAGVAWDIFGNARWVLHGGYGIYHDQVTLGNIGDLMKSNPPNYVVPSFTRGTATAQPIFSLGTQNTYPFGYTYPAFVGTPLDAKGGVPGQEVNIGSVDPNIHSPTTQNWSGSVEHPLTSKLIASVGYTGSHSSGIQQGGGAQGGNQFGVDVNAVEGAVAQNSYATGNVDGSGSPLYTVNENFLNSSFGQIIYSYNAARANYWAVVASVKGQFRRAFFVASYTRSSSKDDANYYSPTPTLNQSRWYGNSPYDYPNRFSAGYSYEIPGYDKGNFLVRGATRGWKLSGTTTLQAGAPIFVYTTARLSYTKDSLGNGVYAPNSGDFNGDGYAYDVPNVSSSYHIPHTRAAYKSGVFPTTAGTCAANLDGCGPFTLPTFGSMGNEAVNDQFRNPAFAQTDFTLGKDTHFHERYVLNLKVDAYNLFNQVNFYAVDPNAVDGTFGQSTTTHTPRYLQVGATLKF